MADNLKQGIDKMVDEATREDRKKTLNKRINYKGNLENYITGGSHALNNAARVYDNKDVVKGMSTPGNGWDKDEWVKGTNDRYTNPEHNRKAGDSPAGSGLNYIHRYTPSTRRGRRVSDIFFQRGRNGDFSDFGDLEEFQRQVNKYERNK